jgi:hypothetical protein
MVRPANRQAQVRVFFVVRDTRETRCLVRQARKEVNDMLNVLVLVWLHLC